MKFTSLFICLTVLTGLILSDFYKNIINHIAFNKKND